MGTGSTPSPPDYATDVDGVFACGDAGRGQSLIVCAIAERACAAAVDQRLSGVTKLPSPILPTARQMMGLIRQSTPITGAPVNARSSVNVVENTADGWPAPAQRTGCCSSQESSQVGSGAGWAMGETPPIT